MSFLARQLVCALRDAHAALDRHPTLFAAHLRDDRSIVQLSAALARYKRAQRPTGGRVEWDEVERVDRDWEDQHSDRRRERFERRHREHGQDRRGRRMQMRPGDLFRLALEREAKLSTVAAGQVEPSRGSATSSLPPRQQLLDDDPRWREHWDVVKRRLLLVHELLDEAEGLGAPLTLETREEKNRLVLVEGQGFSCEAVVDLLGRDIAGSPRTVWRIRKHTHAPPEEQRTLLGFSHFPVRMIDGQPVEPPSAVVASPGVRRVRID